MANPRPRTVYLSRHGFSEYNVLGKLGGNPPLSKWGEEYAKRLGAWEEASVGDLYEAEGGSSAWVRSGMPAVASSPIWEAVDT